MLEVMNLPHLSCQENGNTYQTPQKHLKRYTTKGMADIEIQRAVAGGLLWKNTHLNITSEFRCKWEIIGNFTSPSIPTTKLTLNKISKWVCKNFKNS